MYDVTISFDGKQQQKLSRDQQMLLCSYVVDDAATLQRMLTGTEWKGIAEARGIEARNEKQCCEAIVKLSK